ncbi:protein of unknown function (plasmid) [Shinella sp. WSC3-e]|nr:hypothetical protein SHINE37_100237 [Rhizobiaceae bacterium]CAK7261787.1 protein of unknown function [Shinella sp. WSC3-e]
MPSSLFWRGYFKPVRLHPPPENRALNEGMSVQETNLRRLKWGLAHERHADCRNGAEPVRIQKRGLLRQSAPSLYTMTDRFALKMRAAQPSRQPGAGCALTCEQAAGRNDTPWRDQDA